MHHSAQVEKEEDDKAAAMKADELFFVDTAGDVESRTNKKRRLQKEKKEAEAALAAQRKAHTQKKQPRRKRKASAAAAEEAQEKKAKAEADEAEVEDVMEDDEEGDEVDQALKELAEEEAAGNARRTRRNREHRVKRTEKLRKVAALKAREAEEKKLRKAGKKTAKPKSSIDPWKISGQQGLDIWGEEEKPIVPTDEKGFKAGFVSDKDLWRPRGEKLRGIRAKNDVLVKAGSMQVAHPGQSINPAPESHQALLQQALEIDTKEREDEEYLLARLRGEFPNATPSEPLPEYDWDGKDEERTDASRLVKNKKMSVPQRNKKARHKALLAEQARIKEQKRQTKQLHMIKSLKKSVANETQQQKEDRDRIERLKVEQPDAQQAPTLGPYQMEEMFPEVMLTEEIEATGGSLRDVRPTFQGVKDQFKRFERRQMIEPRVYQEKHLTRKKFMPKQIDRHKNWTLESEAPGCSRAKKPKAKKAAAVSA